MSIRFRTDRKKWERSLLVGGKRKRLLFDTKTEASNCRPVESEIIELTDNITIEKAIKSYSDNVSVGKSKTSRKNERLYFNLMFHFLSGRGLTHLQQVRYGHMLALQNWLLEPKCLDGRKYEWSPATVNRAFNSIKDFFVYWVRDEKLLSSPCAHLAQLEHEDHSRRPMALSEFALALKQADEWFKPTMLFIHLTASAPSTVARLKWSDVDYEQGLITLTRRKGAKGRWRRIAQPMTDALYEVLSSIAPRHEHVFSNESGEPLTAEWCSRSGNRAIRRAGLKGVVLYSIRHALASELTDANVNLEVVRQLMGHSNIRTTQRYAKPRQETLANALKLVRGSDLPPNCHQESASRRPLVAGENS